MVHFTAGRHDAVAKVEGGICNGYYFFVSDPDSHVYQNFELECWGSHAGPSETRRQREPLPRRNRGLLRGQGPADGRGMLSPWFNEPNHYRRCCEPIPRGVPDPARDLAAGEVSALPPLSFAPARYPVVAERFQEFANEIAGLRLEEDGMAGGKTLGAFMTIFGYPLVGREEST